MYDWKCPCCKGEFEKNVPLDLPIAVICPHCLVRCEKLPSAPPFTVKGGTPKFHK